jgi:hypothetical protein
MLLYLCFVGGVVASYTLFRTIRNAVPSTLRSIVVKFSVAETSGVFEKIPPNASVKSMIATMKMNVTQSQVDDCVESYCSLCSNPVFCEMYKGVNLMEIEIDDVMVIQMRVKSTNKDFNTDKKDDRK